MQIIEVKNSIKDLEKAIVLKESRIAALNASVSSRQIQLSNANKKLSQRQPYPAGNLPLMHPMRQLQSLGQSLQQERITKAKALLFLFPFSDDEGIENDPLIAVHSLSLISEILNISFPFPMNVGPSPFEKNFRISHPTHTKILSSTTQNDMNLQLRENLAYLASLQDLKILDLNSIPIMKTISMILGSAKFGSIFNDFTIRVSADAAEKDGKIFNPSEWTLLDKT
jgi:hypothetical protein